MRQLPSEQDRYCSRAALWEGIPIPDNRSMEAAPTNRGLETPPTELE